MSNSQNSSVHSDDGLGFHGENNNVGVSVPSINLGEVPKVKPVDVSSHIALNADFGSAPGKSVRREARAGGQGTHGIGYGGVSLQVIFEMLQAQQVATAQLQSQHKTPSIVEPENTRHTEPVPERSNGNGSGTDPTIMRMLEELTKRIESGEKEIVDNDKKMETYNFRVDQIPGAPLVLKGLDAKKFVQKSFPPSAALKLIPKKFGMPNIPKYNGATNPNEHITSYTYGIKGNDLNNDEIESVLLKKFGETLSKGAMILYHNLPPNSIDSFAMLADAFVKAHDGAIKVATRKSNVLKIRHSNDEILREFISQFQMERMDLPPVSDDWAVQAFMQGMNKRSSITSRQLKQNLVDYPL
ncbi:uncharacterized protein [Nicotiana sylvestris]|uniref:uncharacterized protein n=1 Tax=Nicotiana sylvestris TaxID=4096 RepID=UPI00388C3619